MAPAKSGETGTAFDGPGLKLPVPFLFPLVMHARTLTETNPPTSMNIVQQESHLTLHEVWGPINSS